MLGEFLGWALARHYWITLDHSLPFGRKGLSCEEFRWPGSTIRHPGHERAENSRMISQKGGGRRSQMSGARRKHRRTSSAVFRRRAGDMGYAPIRHGTSQVLEDHFGVGTRWVVVWCHGEPTQFPMSRKGSSLRLGEGNLGIWTWSWGVGEGF